VSFREKQATFLNYFENDLGHVYSTKNLHVHPNIQTAKIQYNECS